MPRPPLNVVKAKKREIRHRYARKRRGHCGKLQFAAIRIAELNRLFDARYGEHLPNDDAGREDAWIAACHLARLANAKDAISYWLEDRCPWLTLEQARDIRDRALSRPVRWNADTLAWRLRLTYADRQALRITSIGAIDVNKAERAKRRAERSKARSKERRERLRRQAANTP